MLKRLWLFITAWFVPPVSAPDPVLEPGPESDPVVRPTRKERRATDSKLRHYIKQRKKFDKFVTPQGPKPKVVERGPLVLKPSPRFVPASAPVEALDDDTDLRCVDVHHSDRQTDVYYNEREFYGEFNFRDTILEQLERYFVYLDRMKRGDVGAYQFYCQVGATLIPYAGIQDVWNLDEEAKKEDVPQKELSTWFLKTRPSFGCLAYGANPECEKLEQTIKCKKDGVKMDRWIPKFLYFVKYRLPPAEIQRIGKGDTYKVTVWWDREDKKRKYGVPNDFSIHVGNDGTLRALKHRETTTIFTKSGERIPQTRWCIPNNYREWARTHKLDVQKFLTNVFCGAVQEIESAGWTMCRVSVEKNGRHALFGLAPNKMPYFFQDRDYSLTKSGLRKRIFHVVKPHRRRDGTYAPMHFRGERKFTWAGYNVQITVPGLDHKPMEEYNVGVIDSGHIPKRELRKYVLEGEVGRRLRAQMDKIFVPRST